MGQKTRMYTWVVLHPVLGSIYAVAMGNRHLCTTGVALHQASGLVLVIFLRLYVPVFRSCCSS